MKKALAWLLTLALVVSMAGCGAQASDTDVSATSKDTEETTTNIVEAPDNVGATTAEERAAIESALDLRNMNAQWTYSEETDAWTMDVVTAVTNPEIEEQQGVSVCVPGAYVRGIDTTGDGNADTTSGTATGTLVIDYGAQVTSTNGQTYTAATAPVILNTGAAGYGSSNNTTASATYANEGYINVSCGNRGKQDSVIGADGNTSYTGDAPCCLVDQKNAARFVKYNIMLGNLPGNVDYFVSTGGSGGGAHAAMFAATSNNPDFYAYEIEAGAVGVYKNEDGSFDTSVTINGESFDISDGAWGCVAYSAITSLAEADMAMAFEYNLDPNYDFGSEFQKKTAEYLAAEYMDYINDKNLSVDEAELGFDLNHNGKTDDVVALTIEYDEKKYADTNGYGGTYLDLYLAEFVQNLQWYLDNLDYADGWTWFDENGNALSDEDVSNMSSIDKAKAFVQGLYAKGSSTDGMGAPDGGMGGPDGGLPDGGMPDGGMPDGAPNNDDGAPSDAGPNGGAPNESTGDAMDVGTPDAGTTQAAGSKTDSSSYASFSDMLSAYEADIASIEKGDKYGNNIVELYDPLNYIGAEGTQGPTWTRIVMGAVEGDMSMLSSLNLQIAWLDAGTDATIEWQWDGGHVPSETLGNSLSLWVDTMYGKYNDDANTIEKPVAEPQRANGDAESATGSEITSWVDASDIKSVSFTLADAAAYRTAHAAKAIPGFDVIDYGQEDYVFGSATADARHWDKYVLKVFQDHKDDLAELFNIG